MQTRGPDPRSRFPVKVPLETLLGESGDVAVGGFACPADHPQFQNSGPSSTYCFVFPRTHVWIRHANAAPFLSGPTLATLYNEGQEYERRMASRRGDVCDWWAIEPSLLEDVLARAGAHPARGHRRLFTQSHVATSAVTYMRQRGVIDRMRAGAGVDAIELEETAIALLTDILCSTRDTPAPALGESAEHRQRALVADARQLLAAWVDRRFELRDLAGALGTSVFHLCRAFRRIERTTIHRYLVDLRLRLALEQLASQRTPDITTVALDLGFCSHSHFTAAFRRAFGATPSAYLASRAHPPR